MRIVGIDPGLSGAYAYLDVEGAQSPMPAQMGVYDIPIFRIGTRKEYDVATLYADFTVLVATADAVHVYVEQSQVMPGQGVRSCFQIGLGFGVWLGILHAAGTPFSLVRPAVWKKAMRLPADKEVCRKRAQELFPMLSQFMRKSRDHNRAEALLLAEYGRRQWFREEKGNG